MRCTESGLYLLFNKKCFCQRSNVKKKKIKKLKNFTKNTKQVNISAEEVPIKKELERKQE